MQPVVLKQWGVADSGVWYPVTATLYTWAGPGGLSLTKKTSAPLHSAGPRYSHCQAQQILGLVLQLSLSLSAGAVCPVPSTRLSEEVSSTSESLFVVFEDE